MNKTINYELPSKETDELFDIKPPKIEWVNPNNVLYCQLLVNGVYKAVMINGKGIEISKEMSEALYRSLKNRS